MFLVRESAYETVTSSLPPQDAPGIPTVGPIVIQGFFQYLCQGVILSQAVKFYSRWQDDPAALRIYMLTLVLFSLLQTILESYKVWLEAVYREHWWISHLHFTEFLCNALICSLCEAFLIRRCYKMTGKKIWVLFGLGTLFVTSLVAGIYLTVEIAIVLGPINFGIRADANPLHTSVFAYPLWVYCTFFTALSLTTILSLSLWRTKTGLAYLDRTLAYIIAMTWESAALPSACMLASAIIYSIRDAQGPPAPVSASAPPSPFAAAHLDLFFAVLTGKVYTLGLLRTLNARTQFRARMHSSDIGRRSLSGWQWDGADATITSAQAQDVGVSASERDACASGMDAKSEGIHDRAASAGGDELGLETEDVPTSVGQVFTER